MIILSLILLKMICSILTHTGLNFIVYLISLIGYTDYTSIRLSCRDVNSIYGKIYKELPKIFTGFMDVTILNLLDNKRYTNNASVSLYMTSDKMKEGRCIIKTDQYNVTCHFRNNILYGTYKLHYPYHVSHKVEVEEYHRYIDGILASYKIYKDKTIFIYSSSLLDPHNYKLVRMMNGSSTYHSYCIYKHGGYIYVELSKDSTLRLMYIESKVTDDTSNVHIINYYNPKLPYRYSNIKHICNNIPLFCIKLYALYMTENRISDSVKIS